MERGWDPDVKKYFLKVLNSFCIGLMWLMAAATAGIYFKLAYTGNNPRLYTIFFYIGLGISLAFLLRYYYRTWRK
jgi:predicted membrane channel-forming protein YqfA (hemolysin III family)